MVVVFKFYCTVFSFACKLKQDLSRPIGTKPESKRMQTSYLSPEAASEWDQRVKESWEGPYVFEENLVTCSVITFTLRDETTERKIWCMQAVLALTEEIIWPRLSKEVWYFQTEVEATWKTRHLLMDLSLRPLNKAAFWEHMSCRIFKVHSVCLKNSALSNSWVVAADSLTSVKGSSLHLI